jgi:adenosyl cobinamide kinase/adenosyl cobinamide phosphate guanylyltransferase
MPLKGKKPETIQKRLKALFYGPPGVGKTFASIHFPAPYLIDTERGAENSQYIEVLKKNNGLIFQTCDADEMINEIRTLLSETHPYKTLIIDPLTTLYNDLLDKGAEELGTDFGRHKGPANRKIKHLLNLLTRLDMNVIITSHAKPKWVRVKNDKGKETVAEEGLTFDCYDKLDYLFDLSCEVQKRANKRVGIVKKTRLESFIEGENFPFDYESIAQKYGKEILERDSLIESLATTQEIEQIRHLIKVLNVPEEIWRKWLDKSNSVDFHEMNSDVIKNCILYLQNKVLNNKEDK